MAKSKKPSDQKKPRVKKLTVRTLTEKDLAHAGGGGDTGTGTKSYHSC